MGVANCNWWQYSRWTYQIGRSVKAKAFTVEERKAIIAFIEGFIATRDALVARLNLKKGNNAEIARQNNYALGKMVQLIGRQIKIVPPTEEEKNLCDTMFALVANNVRIPGWTVLENYKEESEEIDTEDENLENSETEELPVGTENEILNNGETEEPKEEEGSNVEQGNEQTTEG